MQSQLSFRCAHRRRGSVTPLTVLSLALLLGVIAVAVDGGSLMEERRHVQATADAGALAAAAANGFSNDGVQSVVTVSVSPQNYQDGPNAGKALPAGYVE